MAEQDYPAYPKYARLDRQAAAAALMGEYIETARQREDLGALTWTITNGGALIGECVAAADERVRMFDAWTAHLGTEREDSDSSARGVLYRGEGDYRFAVVVVARDYGRAGAAAAA